MVDIKYYRLDEILEYNAHYNIIVGERSNGKTYASLEFILEKYVESGEQGALIRRFRESIRGKRASTIFANHNDIVIRLTNGDYDRVVYRSSRFYLAKLEEDEKLRLDHEPFCYAFALSEVEHDKSTSYPRITTIVFDEFITRRAYLYDEFVIFMNTLSTIIRNRSNARIFMLGNTVNKYCPYFDELGLKHITKQKQGTIDLYRLGEDEKLKIAVEYCSPMKSKPSNTYFAFDNPKLTMIRSGAWELDLYPHLPYKYRPKDVVMNFFIEFDNKLFQGDIIEHEGDMFAFIHPKTTPIKNETDIVFTNAYSPSPYVFSYFSNPIAKVHKRIYQLFAMGKVFYSDNSTGEAISNFIKTSNRRR